VTGKAIHNLVDNLLPYVPEFAKTNFMCDGFYVFATQAEAISSLGVTAQLPWPSKHPSAEHP
jgi:hypothetical protein